MRNHHHTKTLEYSLCVAEYFQLSNFDIAFQKTGKLYFETPKCNKRHIHYFVQMSSTDLIDFDTEVQNKEEEEVETQETEEVQEEV